jgi:hypothetical protein
VVARRLLIVMLVLLGLSTLAAALVPPQREPGGTATTQTTSPRTSKLPPGGELVRATIDADGRRPERIEVPLGDQLALEVRSRRLAEIQIPALGLIEDATRGAPARFDILARREGAFEVRRIEPRVRLGVIGVTGRGGP